MTKFNFNYLTACFVFLSILNSSVVSEKYKMCVVDGKGMNKKSLRYCPQLDALDSKVECVVAPDRTDCLRQILKGKADFSVFSPEDLITANNEGIEILVTNELRYTDGPNEYEVVAVIDKKSGIKSRHDLKGKRYCHPGYGYETDWTTVLSNYFEASVVTPSCDPSLTLEENKIKASAEYFRASCKAGPWVNDPVLDRTLKQKYSHLCALCGDPNQCSVRDKYWGRRGSLLCLTDEAGDISWARLDDVKPHFGLVQGPAEADPDGYNFLCPDDTLMPLNSSNPCAWVVKPWPVVAARRSTADEIQKIVSPLTHNDRTTWRFDLLMLLETSFATIFKLPTLAPIETYLYNAKGYLSANSFSGCHPPRTIRICTTSVLESAKCSWMRESAAVYGIEPDLDCIKADNHTHCMLALNLNAADVVVVPTDLVHTAKKKFNLKTFFYETVSDDEKYLTVAVTRPGSDILALEDLKGKKACFPVFNGVAWNTMKNKLFEKEFIQSCPLDEEMTKFFGSSCIPGLPDIYLSNMKQNCQTDEHIADFKALHCLISKMGDVAFVSKNSIGKFLKDGREEKTGLSMKDFKILCEKESQPCFLSWAPIGQAMIRANTTDLWIKDSLDVFLQLDELFGKNFKSLTNAFTLLGKYDGTSNLLFQDETLRLRAVPILKDTDSTANLYENLIEVDDKCIHSGAQKIFPCWIFMYIISVYLGKCFISTFI